MWTSKLIAATLAATVSIIALSSSATPIVDQRWDGFAPEGSSLQSQNAFSAGYAPFQAINENPLKQILWWGTAASNDFTIRLHQTLKTEDGVQFPDITPFIELTVVANSSTAGESTELFWVDLAIPINLPLSATYLSIFGDEFFWHNAEENKASSDTIRSRRIGPTDILIFYPFPVAFVLNDTIEPVPEPSTALFLAFGLTALGFGRRSPIAQ